MKKYLFICSFLLSVLLLVYGCKKDKDDSSTPVSSNRSISGSAQKGPFLNGSSVSVFELNSGFSQTGRTFSSVISDNSGSFQLNNLSLVSNYVQMRVDGFYFNEVCGTNSNSQITLNCIADVSSSTPIHVNLLTHLEKPRVEYLLSTGLPFDSAKKEAQTEILNIFNISFPAIQNSEQLDISQSGDGNAILLALSAILQGYRTESELSSILASICNDLQSDGILNDNNTMSSLIDHAILLDTINIRNNIVNFYSSLGTSASVPDFEKYYRQFVDNSSFPKTYSVINYPATGLYGENLLQRSKLAYTGSSTFSMTARSKTCAQLKIRIHRISGALYGYLMGTEQNLNITRYDDTNDEQFFTVIDPAQTFDLNIQFLGSGTYLFEYFEENFSIPSFTKTITVN